MGTSRQLAVIMFTDVVGYSAMMADDEHKALDILKQNKEIHESLLQKVDGKLLKEMGDGMLLYFANATDAIGYAATLQHFTGQHQYQLKIGIHLGEVVFENGDVFGSGVNIASRLEPLANPGEVIVSEDVSHNLENKPGIKTEYIDEVKLKNIPGKWKLFKAHVDDAIIQKIIASPVKKVTQDPGKTPSWMRQVIKWMAFGFIGVSLGIGLWMGTGSGQLVEGIDNATVRKLREMTITVLPFEGPASGALSEFSDMAPYWIKRRLREVDTGKVVDVGDARNHEDIDSSLIERTGLEGVIQGRYFVSAVPDSILELYVNFVYLDTRENLELGYYKGSTEDPRAVLYEATERILSIWTMDGSKRWAENPPRFDAFKMYNQAQMYFTEGKHDEAFRLLDEAFKLDSSFYDAKLKTVIFYEHTGQHDKSDSVLQIFDHAHYKMDYWSQLRFKAMKAWIKGDLEEEYRNTIEMADFDPFDFTSLTNAFFASIYTLRPEQGLSFLEKLKLFKSGPRWNCTFRAALTAQAYFLLKKYDKIEQLVNFDRTEACPNFEFYNPGVLFYHLRSLVRKDQMDRIDSLIPVYLEYPFWQIEDEKIKKNVLLLSVIQELSLLGKEEQMLEFMRANKYFPIKDFPKWFFPHATSAINWYYSLTGDHQRALSITDSLYRQDTTNLRWVTDLAIFSAQTGDTTRAQIWLKKLESRPVEKYDRGKRNYLFAQVKSAMGRKAEAMDCLEKAYKEGYPFYSNEYQDDYALKNMFDYPPFQKFVELRD